MAPRTYAADGDVRAPKVGALWPHQHTFAVLQIGNAWHLLLSSYWGHMPDVGALWPHQHKFVVLRSGNAWHLLLSSYWGNIPDVGALWLYYFICVVLEVAKEKGWYSTANSLLHCITRGAVRPGEADDKEVRRM